MLLFVFFDHISQLTNKAAPSIMKKILVFTVTLILSCSVVAAFYFKNLPSQKGMNPIDPNFNAENFRWDDYETAEQLADVFRVIFPVGTEKSYVDKILLSQSGATTSYPVDIAEYKAKTGGKLASPTDEKILYADPKFMTAKTLVKYNYPMKAPLINFAASTSWSTTVYYDEKDRVLNIKVYTFIVHNHSVT